MRPHSEPSSSSAPREALAGLVERVTFHNADNGFCVLRVKTRGHRDFANTVRYAASISAGECITASGEWVNDRIHGQPFRAQFLRASAPTSIDGIEDYLGSGMIRRIGPVDAKKLVRAFGEKVFDMIEQAPQRLREVEGIGPVRAERIRGAWAEQKVVREIMVFLHSHAVARWSSRSTRAEAISATAITSTMNRSAGKTSMVTPPSLSVFQTHATGWAGPGRTALAPVVRVEAWLERGLDDSSAGYQGVSSRPQAATRSSGTKGRKASDERHSPFPRAGMESAAMTASKVAQQRERPPEDLHALPKGMVMRAAVREWDASADP